MRALVLSGDGINCEVETQAAAIEAGFETRIVHINDFLSHHGQDLNQCDLLIIPGGFSFGDELGSGKILALKLKFGLKSILNQYFDRGGAALGICNGFQVLTRLGVFGSNVVLAQNRDGHFINRWVSLNITGKSIFTRELVKAGVRKLELPIRHGEGRLLFSNPTELNTIKESDGFVLRYDEDVNGSFEQLAGLSAYDGRVMGLMPHPEAYWSHELHPWGMSRGVPLGVEMFKSAYVCLSELKSLSQQGEMK